MEWFFQIEVNGNFLHKSNSSSIGMEHYSVYTVHAKIPVTEVKDKKKKKKRHKCAYAPYCQWKNLALIIKRHALVACILFNTISGEKPFKRANHNTDMFATSHGLTFG